MRLPTVYRAGAPFIFGALLMLVAVGVAATIPVNAGSHRPAAAAVDGDHHQHQQQQQAGSSGSSLDPERRHGNKDAAAGWPAGEEAQPSGRASRGSVDLEGGGPGHDGPSERTRLLD